MHTFLIIITIIDFIGVSFISITYGMEIEDKIKIKYHIAYLLMIATALITAILMSKIVFQEQVKTKKEPIIETIVKTKENKADTTYIYHFK